jgi:signal transduction histidine kinase
LTLAQTVARLHGGKLTIEQEDTHALTIVLWLPGVETP